MSKEKTNLPKQRSSEIRSLLAPYTPLITLAISELKNETALDIKGPLDSVYEVYDFQAKNHVFSEGTGESEGGRVNAETFLIFGLVWLIGNNFELGVYPMNAGEVSISYSIDDSKEEFESNLDIDTILDYIKEEILPDIKNLS